MRPVLLSLLLLSACSPAHALKSGEVNAGGQMYAVVTIQPGLDVLRLYWQRPDGQPYGLIGALKSDLAKQGKTLLFATNSGIYAPGLRPLGLHVQAGRELVGLNHARSGGNFALLPNGVFWIKGNRAGVTESRAYERLNMSPDFASQSGPLLVQGGQLHPSFNAGSKSVKLRSGVGVCAGGVVKFAMSEGAVNFYDFARFFRDTLGCPDALYLDGSISTFYTPDRGDSQLLAYAGIWGVTK
ncbi:phosphodiester glycosidase family protein [Deinococcus ruber]|nr:phosphodiester glycosidase family protein [Deinococcus ruber]